MTDTKEGWRRFGAWFLPSVAVALVSIGISMGFFCGRYGHGTSDAQLDGYKKRYFCFTGRLVCMDGSVWCDMTRWDKP